MLVDFLRKNRFFRYIIYRIGRRRANDMIGNFEHLLKKKDAILDIGSGSCNVSEILSKRQYKVVSLDVQNLSFVKSLSPLLYNGKRIPFRDDSFDVSLILAVLHHTTTPENIIKEAGRVSKKIIIIEDIYSTKFQKYLTYFFDSLSNLEIIGHPHKNQNDEGWKKTFKKLGLKLIDVKYSNSLFVFKHATYYCVRIPGSLLRG
jgi:ubiquinone/menaquinone biosynthesis C-methylase UbiE